MERKLATVVFVDLVASTELVAGADPEVVRRRVNRFFDQVSSCITTHGGTVEKFAGDAVMAAFGVPLAHEDDADRAIRAALAILERVRELGLEARIGIESGEVVADDAESTFATGEAVNLAARLQQAASAGELLIGPGTHRLAHAGYETEAVGPLELRGWPAPVDAYRVVCPTDGGAPLGGLSAPLVGRESELELLENTYGRTVRDRRASLFTIYGEPGVGKSRLAREFLAGLEGATVLGGRCLPYGEGVTYWPLAEMVKSSAGISDDDPSDIATEKLRATCEDEAVADLLALAAGVLEALEGERSPQEIAWAARAWAEQLGAAQPLVLAFEDIHWAEEPLLDLLEYLAAWVKEAPLMLVCLARPELLDVRPGWGGGRVRATSIELEPLPPEQSLELATALLAERRAIVNIPDVLAKSEGNPLFVEETIRMLVEEGGRDGTAERIPDTLQALIAARIDRLAPAQRVVLQRASIIGRIFWAGAIDALSPELEGVDEALDDLLLRDFVVRESRSSITGESAFRFKHVLIREVAYGGLSKSARAEYHARFAKWLYDRAGEELLEIRAFHLDQAARLETELEGAPPPELARDAAGVLTKAGRRALNREAFKTARKLLLRAGELDPSLDRRYLAARAAWRIGDMPVVAVEMEEVRVAAEKSGDRRIHGRALTALAEVALTLHADVPAARTLVDQALEILDGEPDVEARFGALLTRALIGSWLGAVDEVEKFSEQALALARESERKDLEAVATHMLAYSYVHRLDVERAEPLIDRALELAEESGSLLNEGAALDVRGSLERVRGNLEGAEEAFAAAASRYQEIGFPLREASIELQLGRVARMRGDAERAEKAFRAAIRTLKKIGDRSKVVEAQRELAQLLVSTGKVDEAERLALEARETVGPEDRVSVATTTMALGVVRAAQGRDDEAELLLGEALKRLQQSPFRSAELEALGVYADFLREAGRDDEAAPLEARIGELSPVSTARMA
jgi:class 3 adenylate cyclase/tetratricopeptide (TPR) repeat protein